MRSLKSLPKSSQLRRSSPPRKSVGPIATKAARSPALTQRFTSLSRRMPRATPDTAEATPNRQTNATMTSWFGTLTSSAKSEPSVAFRPAEEIPIEVAMAGIRDQLLEADNRQQPFSTLFPRDLGLRGLISYFMALLELTRLRHLQLEQNDDFGDILVILREAA